MSHSPNPNDSRWPIDLSPVHDTFQALVKQQQSQEEQQRERERERTAQIQQQKQQQQQHSSSSMSTLSSKGASGSLPDDVNARLQNAIQTINKRLKQ
jgi:hypothetical protein